jgi:PAS domain-containing protein
LIALEDRKVVLGYCHDRANKQEAPEQYEYRGLRKDGSILWLENFSTNILWNGRPCIQAAVVDTSARKHIEQTLQEGEARFHHFAEASSDWFWEMDEELRYTWLSDRFEGFTTFPREWHYGKTREELRIPKRPTRGMGRTS